MDIFFKVNSICLIAFSIWMVYAFAKEWKPLYKNKE